MVMFLLIGDVLLLFNRFKTRLAHGERCIATLPFKIGIIAALLFQPSIGDTFQFFYPFGLRDGAGESGEQMDVIFDATDKDRNAIKLFRDGAEIGMKRFACGLVAQKWPAVFGGENEMDVNSR